MKEERMRAQLIVGAHECAAPEDVVAHLGAIQAQEYAWAKWAVGLRCAKTITEADVEQAVNDGRILRTHAFRGTWQFICPADLRWMCSLVAANVLGRSSARNEELRLDEATFKRSNKVIERALRDGGVLTRHEIADALRKAKVSPDGQRLPHLLMRAELETIICSGARRGKQATYALVDARAPKTKSLSRDEALRELARRYFTSRGPATVADFMWWTGLPAKDVRAAVQSAPLASDVIDGVTYFRSKEPRKKSKARSARVHLLPMYDEYLVAYKNRDAQLDPAHVKRINAGGGLLAPCVVLDGRVIGIWRRDASSILSFAKLTKTEGALVVEARAAYQRFAS